MSGTSALQPPPHKTSVLGQRSLRSELFASGLDRDLMKMLKICRDRNDIPTIQAIQNALLRLEFSSSLNHTRLISECLGLPPLDGVSGQSSQMRPCFRVYNNTTLVISVLSTPIETARERRQVRCFYPRRKTRSFSCLGRIWYACMGRYDGGE